ncbi:General transcription factor IIE subunit 1 [Orchesella cincta]|uniref:General transcription factor IIE subunit 1 n=1 Tax=Orchesella cincta TaxID=48709 RepID=A0A1D2M6Y4_ORCCI|nr:General transcription factor IIE subunit 1 [Orchesella cincta]
MITFGSDKVSGGDGKGVRTDFYYIQYGKLANVVKYKLDNVRRRLDTLERDANTMNSFYCDSCNKSWTDLEAGELFNIYNYSLKCNLCGSQVKEDVSRAIPSSRNTVMKFNMQASPLYDLLEQAEAVYPTVTG